MKYPNDFINKIICGDCQKVMKQIPDNSIDLIVTDPPYGLSFMGKDWDKAVPSINIWKECLRVLKPGAFAFIMSGPRQDVLSQMIIRLGDAGFNTGFTSIYWTYASGFPKATNIGKMVDKKLGKKRRIIGYEIQGKKSQGVMAGHHGWAEGKVAITKGNSLLEGSYGGFQPKPAIELILIVMKPLSEKTYVEQALKNKKGITWLDDCRIPIKKGDEPQGGYGDMNTGIGKPLEHQKYTKRKPRSDHNVFKQSGFKSEKNNIASASLQGRFPANLLVSNNILDTNKIYKSGKMAQNIKGKKYNIYGQQYDRYVETIGDSGLFSRFFDLDKWTVKKEIKDVFPFLICPKASRKEKNKGCENLPEKKVRGNYQDSSQLGLLEKIQNSPRPTCKNYHPTVKPLKLMAYLITLGSRINDTILDPFIGSGTTVIACKELNRKCIGIEISKEYCNIAIKRLKNAMSDLFKT